MSIILIVEDNVSIRQPMARLLRSEGYESICVENGRAALEAIGMLKPDLVLLDLIMPVMDGMEFLKILRQNARWAGLPVIVCSGASPGDPCFQQARHLGVKDFFHKMNFSTDQLFTSIHRNLAA
jgi:CheY-like chemotaxis protein